MKSNLKNTIIFILAVIVLCLSCYLIYNKSSNDKDVKNNSSENRTDIETE